MSSALAPFYHMIFTRLRESRLKIIWKVHRRSFVILRVHRTRIHARSTCGIIVSSLEYSSFSSSFAFISDRCFLLLLLYFLDITVGLLIRLSFATSSFSCITTSLASSHLFTSFCQEPHLLSIFARWLCVGYSFSWDQRVRNIRYAGESFIFLFSFVSSFLLLFALNLHRRISSRAFL